MPDTDARPLRILLVEDDADARFIMSRLLRRAGHTVAPAADAAAALACAAREHFDVVLSDIGLPGMDGCALMAEMRRAHGLPGVALSGFADTKHAERCRAAGFAEFLPKPAEFPDVLAALSRAASGATGG